MDILDNNPFRILGLAITASERDIAKQVNILATYAEMGKSRSCDTDFAFLSSITRTPDVIQEAKTKIERGENRMLYSLFWFWDNNTVDALALDLLKEGNIDRAIEIWEKAVFKNYHKVYKPVTLVGNLIRESSKWLEEDDDDHSLKKGVDTYTIERKSKTGRSIPCVYADFAYDEINWSIECDIEWIEGVDNIGYGVVFGRSNKSYFSFELAAGGYYRIDKYVEWNCTTLLPWTESDEVEMFGTNHIRVEKIADLFVLHINGNVVNTVRSEPLFGKYFGFTVAHGQKIVFRDLKICKLEEDNTYGEGISISPSNFSCVKNLSVLFLGLATNNGSFDRSSFTKGATLAGKVFADEQIEEYSRLIAGDNYVYNAKVALQFFVSGIVDSIRVFLDRPLGIATEHLVRAFAPYPLEANRYIRNRFIVGRIQKISKEIENTQLSRKNSPSKAVDAGKSLLRSTNSDIQFLSSIFDESDFEYQTVADNLANEVVQCGIDFFNATRNDEPCLALYQYGYAVAASPRIEERAKENLDSCNEWIKNKIYYFCWFCGKNQPDSNCSCYKTIYRETSRSWFPRSVRFTYVDILIPRCSECLEVQNKTPDKYWAAMIGCFSAVLVIGTIVGAIVDSIPAAGAGDGAGTETGAIVGALVGAFIGWIAGQHLKSSQLTIAGVKGTSNSTISQCPIVSQRLEEGWQFSKPTA